jgi:hypothetical protein
MSPLCYVLAALTAVFAVCCISLRRKGKSFEGMLFKFLASFAFVSVAIVGYSFSPKETYYFCLVSFALMFGFFGDVLLGIKEIAPKFKSKGCSIRCAENLMHRRRMRIEDGALTGCWKKSFNL